MGKILQILVIENKDLAHAQTFCTRVTPRYGQYLTHAPSHITREVAILVPRARCFLVKLSRVALETRKGSGGHGGRAVSPSLRLMSMGP